jgi:hypothetical protein
MLSQHSDTLLPAVAYRLAQPATGCWFHVQDDLLRGLRSWGDQAAGAAPVLTRLLTRPGRNQHAIATVLGRIGPAAAAAVPVLDELIPSAGLELAGVLTWARWRITGEHATQAAQLLAQMAATAPHQPDGLRLLATLGPAAAVHEPVIRAQLLDSYEWVRAEAANALWRCTGDTTSTVPVLTRLISDHGWLQLFMPVHSVSVECLGNIGPPAEAAAPPLTRYLQTDERPYSSYLRHDPISWDQHGQRLTTAALNAIRPARP